MKTLKIQLDENGKCFKTVTPFNQGFGIPEEKRFDGNWGRLAHHVTGGNYYKYELI